MLRSPSQEDLEPLANRLGFVRNVPNPNDEDVYEDYCDEEFFRIDTDSSGDDHAASSCPSHSLSQESDTNAGYYLYESIYDKETPYSNVKYIDSHCHLHWVFSRANYRGTFASYRELNKATFPKSFQGCVNIYCRPQEFSDDTCWQLLNEDKIWGAIGCHPNMVGDYSYDAERHLENALNNDKIVALGEIGLDYSKNPDEKTKELQQFIFRKQIQIGIRRRLPLVIHSRDSDIDAFKILKELVPANYRIHRHCYTGDWKNLEDWLLYFPNLYVGLTNVVTYPSAFKVQQVARNMPLNRLLLETDAPYFVPKNAGLPSGIKSSHPGMAYFVASAIADLRPNETIEDILSSTMYNTKKLFSI
ncbi:Putative deoxyribonuclease tatdn2 [Chamberlinius hualienensis]